MLNYSVATAMPLAAQTSCDIETSVPYRFTCCCKMSPYHSSGTKTWPVIMEARVQSQAGPSVISDGKSSIGTGFSPSSCFPLSLSSTKSPYSFIHSSIHLSITEAIEYQQFTASLSSTDAAILRLKAIITLVLRGLVHPSQRLALLVSRCE